MTDIQDLSKKLREEFSAALKYNTSDFGEHGTFIRDEYALNIFDSKILPELDRLIEVEKVLRKELEKISEDFGTDYCDGNCLGAHEALKRADEIGKGKDGKA